MRSIRRLWIATTFIFLLAGYAQADLNIIIPDQDAEGLKITTMVADGQFDSAVDALLKDEGANDSSRSIVLANFQATVKSKGGLIDKIFDKTYGTSERQIIYTLSADGATTFYFRYNFKRWPKGWVFVNFAFEASTADLFPKVWTIIP